MKGHRPPVTSWRAFVDCEQIGFRFASEAEAVEASETYIAANYKPHMLDPVVVIRPSYSPIKNEDPSLSLSVK